MRRGKTTTYGQKGGEGPTKGKKAVTYIATAPSGKVLTLRVFDDIPLDAAGQPLQTCVAGLVSPANGHDWIFWFVAASRDEVPDWMRSRQLPADVVFVEARIKTAADRVAKPSRTSS